MKLIPFSVALNNGSSVRIREVTPEDRHLLEIGYDHLSEQSRYFRFLASRHDLTPSELDVFTAFNGPDHVAVGALCTDTPMPEPIGIARYVRLPDQKHTAEIAVTIVDTYQRQGLGHILLGVLTKFARHNEISEFYALVHRDNTAMLGLLGQFGGKQHPLDSTEIEVRIPIVSHDTKHPTSSVDEAIRNIRCLAIIA
jgi:RimJ/RimL family protein N-acetyltransferase